jgi:ornithine cyclodeaminase/alanine dehydrogenase-like protein (mu-crystallin family)
VGAYTPQTRELDTVTIRRAKVVVDTYQGALAEAGELLIPMAEGAIGRDHVLAELAEVVTGARSVRTSPEDITVFKSVGFALEDLAAARLAYRKARAAGRGTRLALN